VSAWASLCLMLIATYLGCVSEPAPVEPSVESDLPALPGPRPKDIEDCALTSFGELRDLCHLGFVVRAVLDGRKEETWEACASIERELWRDECHFLVAETLSRKGMVAEAFDHCVMTGSFASNCFNHAVWITRPLARTASPSDAGAADGIERTITKIALAARNPHTPEFQFGLDMLRTSSWFELYYGSGLADPTAARNTSGTSRLDGRSAFAWEAVRLLDADVAIADRIATVLAVWQGRKPALRGPPIPFRCWEGRNTVRREVLKQSRGPMAHTPHDGLRLVGESEEEDLAIATMEAAFFDIKTSAGTFTVQLSDPSPRIRLTAERLEWRLGLETTPPRTDVGPGVPLPGSKGAVGEKRARQIRVFSRDLNREGCP